MKKLLTVLFAVLMLVSVCGCSKNDETEKQEETAVVEEETKEEIPAPTDPCLEMTSTFKTSVGDAKVSVKLGANGYYKGVADLGNYGSKDFASGSWTKDGNAITLVDVNGNTYTSVVNGDQTQITGKWDVGAMVGTEMTLTIATADIK